MRFIPIPPFTVASLLGCAWLAACGVTVPVSRPSIRIVSEAEVYEIRRASICNGSGSDAAVELLQDAAAVKAWQDARGIDLIGSKPLPAGPFAVVDHGTRTTGGYGLAVSRRGRLREGALKLTASFLSPKPDEIRPYALTSPCVLVKLPAGSYSSVEVVDPSGRRRAVTATAAP